SADSVVTKGSGCLRTKVPWPGRVTTSPRMVSHLMASLMVFRDAMYSSRNSFSFGSCAPGLRTPDSIFRIRSWAICRYLGSEASAITPPARPCARYYLSQPSQQPRRAYRISLRQQAVVAACRAVSLLLPGPGLAYTTHTTGWYDQDRRGCW